MSKKVRALWIDDDLGHVEDAKNLEGVIKSLRVELLHPERLEKRLAKYSTSRQKSPDIFLVDYYLNRKADESEKKYPHFGLTAAAEIREHYQEYPIYLVTQVETSTGEPGLENWVQAAKASFDDVLTFSELQRRGAIILYYDALDYKLVREATRGELNTLFVLLKAPQGVRERLSLVLPNELKQGLTPSDSSNIEGNAVAFTRWVRDFLFATPGFLYDNLHASTHLGVNVDKFKEVSLKLGRAKYSGVFSKTTKRLWWVSELDEILFSHPKAQKTTTTNPWEVAPSVFGISEGNRTKCAVCSGPLPETVGINLENDTDLRPVHYRCSKPHPQKRRELYFDEPRAFELTD